MLVIIYLVLIVLLTVRSLSLPVGGALNFTGTSDRNHGVPLLSESVNGPTQAPGLLKRSCETSDAGATWQCAPVPPTMDTLIAKAQDKTSPTPGGVDRQTSAMFYTGFQNTRTPQTPNQVVLSAYLNMKVFQDVETYMFYNVIYTKWTVGFVSRFQEPLLRKL